MSSIQQTLVVLKPDAVGRTIVGDIITRFERVGLSLVGMKLTHADKKLLHDHYEGIGKLGSRRGENVLDIVIKMMNQGPVVAMVWEGVEAVEIVRKLVGPTEPKSAAPGTIRGDYAHMSFGYLDINPGTDLYNIIHASADLGEAQQEVPLWFDTQEIFSHEKPHTKYFK